jgi:hypothetical protein
MSFPRKHLTLSAHPTLNTILPKDKVMKSKNQSTAENIAERLSNGDVQDVISEVSERGEQVRENLQEVGREIHSRIKDLHITSATVPDVFRKSPKFISPKVHRWLDVAVTGHYAVLSIVCAIRGRKGAAIAAAVNAGMVAGVSAFTDYEGNGEKPISFKLHGTLDAVQATTAALAPMLHGFAGEPEAKFFYGQAANEVAVIASTDWDAGMRRRRLLRRAA